MTSDYQRSAMLETQVQEYRELLSSMRRVLSVTDTECRDLAALLREARAQVTNNDTGLGQRIDNILRRYPDARP